MSLQKRKLGRSGLEVAPLAFGGNVFGWTIDESTSFQLLDAFVASGCNLIDTADIDLYQAHQDDPNTPLDETLDTFARLIQQGKVRAIGASNYSAERLSEALDISERRGYPRYESLQPQYNLYD